MKERTYDDAIEFHGDIDDAARVETVDSRMLPLDRIVLNERANPRSRLDPDTVRKYAAAMKAGVAFPPVEVFSDGNDYYLADGFHRVAAASEAGKDQISVHVRKGGLRQAVLFAAWGQAPHGLERTAEDKRQAAAVLLDDYYWRSWNDSDIANHCGIDELTVAAIRNEKGARPSPASLDLLSAPDRERGEQLALDIKSLETEIQELRKQLRKKNDSLEQKLQELDKIAPPALFNLKYEH